MVVRVQATHGGERVTARATRLDRLTPAYKSKWEEQYAVVLEARRRAGEVAWYRYEGLRLRLAEGAWYTPDFPVVTADGTLEIHEVKGRWREAALVRWKLVKELYPLVFRLVTKQGARFVETEE